MRTCRFYSPSQPLVDRFPELKAASDYEFDRPFGFSSCNCPGILNGAPFASCGYESEFGNCGFYQPEDLEALRSIVIIREDAEVALLRKERVRLGVRRINQGLPEYHVTVETLADTETETWDQAVVLHTVSSKVHGPLAKGLAEELFNKEVEEERSRYPREDAPLSDLEKVSYLETVVTV